MNGFSIIVVLAADVACYHLLTITSGISSGHNKVCPVVVRGNSVLQPLSSPRISGSFYVNGTNGSEAWFTLRHIERPCWVQSSTSTSTTSSVEATNCDQLWIEKSGNPDRRSSFFIRYDPSGGVSIFTKISYG